ncbi:MAG: TIGR02611 family protein [Jatrophihabitantaceae bacterium]
MTSIRTRMRATRGGRLAWRAGVSVFGVAIIIAGIILLPLPGPGWLIIFAGLGLLATEFDWAARLLRFARAKVSRWTNWVATRSRSVQALLGLSGLIAVAAAGWVAYRYYSR